MQTLPVAAHSLECLGVWGKSSQQTVRVYFEILEWSSWQCPGGIYCSAHPVWYCTADLSLTVNGENKHSNVNKCGWVCTGNLPQTSYNKYAGINPHHNIPLAPPPPPTPIPSFIIRFTPIWPYSNNCVLKTKDQITCPNLTPQHTCINPRQKTEAATSPRQSNNPS